MEKRDCQNQKRDKERKVSRIKDKFCFPCRFFKVPDVRSGSRAKNNNSMVLLYTCLPCDLIPT